jgi:WD40-like Beta Propeller Repeat
MFPEGLAAKLPKGSDFLLQMHFHLSGKSEQEKSLIGIYFADRAPEKAVFSVELPALFAFGAGIDIPPGEKRFTLQDSFTLPGDVKVYSATAHAHYLAKEMKATATLPDGSTKPLIWIDDWDFNWQDSYVYKQPFTLPAGTRIDATIIYDNSADNPRNPVDPPRRALWGEQSFDEMGTIGFTFEALQQADVPRFQSALGARNKAAIAAAGENGTLQRFMAHQKRQNAGLEQLTIYDRSGSVVTRVGEPGAYSQASFSPDGTRLAAIKIDPARDTQDVWAFDIATGKGTAVTEDAAIDTAPVWSPDGQYIAYVSARDNVHGIYRRAANGHGPEELLYKHTTAALIVLTDWSMDGRFLGFWNGDTMFILPLEGERKVIQLGKEDFFGRGGRLSPDGRFLAFNSNRSGRFQVYVSPIDPETGTRSASAPAISQVTTDGGIGGIVWRKDGKELFYLSQPPKQTLMVVDVSGAGAAPQRLFELPVPIGAPAQLSNICSADGQRFVFAVNVRKPPPR